jgi:hypothetical protein
VVLEIFVHAWKIVECGDAVKGKFFAGPNAGQEHDFGAVERSRREGDFFVREHYNEGC